ncbi:MAG TPA: nitrate- and nitrite sensing domain-containing protein [Trebonia sp.]|nr:nitrate- and nitrite sensing domain-containing protein [Trebonia sp.]
MTSPDVPGSERPAGHAAVSRRSFRPHLPQLPSRASLALRNWPVSRRLIAVIVLAVVMGLVFGGLRVASAIGTASSFARTTQLAVLGEQVTALAQAMETERDMFAAVLADDRVIAAATRTLNLTEQIGAQFPAATQARAATVVSQIGLIPALRSQLIGQTPSAAIQAYSEAIADLFNLNDEITSGSGDPALSDEVRTLGAISRAKDQASQQRAILYAALIESAANDPAALADAGGLQALTTAAGLEQADLMAFQASATPAEQDAFLSTVASPEVDTAQLLGNFISQAQNLQDVKNLSPKGSAVITPATAPDLWYHAMTDTINRMRTIELQVAGRIVARSTMLQQGARESATLAGAVTAGVLLLVLIATLIVARSLVEPLRRLQADALEVASVRLPSRVAELSQSAEPDVSRGVEPIGVDSTDEIGRVARAFDQVHQEAVRLAGNEALLRGNVSAMFISLSRRSVPLIDRLTRMIDELEQNEDDPDRLSSLFAMDHLVTRMRRNSENLLVLAGEEPVRKWSEPVPLADVARAATSEIEQYGRIVLNIQPGIVVSGQAAADVVHLLAEIIENATMFSPRDTPVQLTGQEVSTGGVLLEVRDAGIGIPPTRLAEMNWRFDNPPLVDVSVSRHMGLFAVSRLAARHGVRVRLQAAAPQGVSALVWLPASLTGRESRRYIDRRSRQLAKESFTVLGLGGRRLAGRAGADLRPLAPAIGQLDMDGELPDGAMQTAAAASGRSDWFRAKRPSGSGEQLPPPPPPPPPPVPAQDRDYAGYLASGTPVQAYDTPFESFDTSGAQGWTLPAGDSWDDGGWRVAETMPPPSTGGQTTAGLPTRVPGANMFRRQDGGWAPSRRPAGGLETELLTPPRRAPQQRSPERARRSLSGFQLGSRDAEASTLSAEELSAEEGASP